MNCIRIIALSFAIILSHQINGMSFADAGIARQLLGAELGTIYERHPLAALYTYLQNISKYFHVWKHTFRRLGFPDDIIEFVEEYAKTVEPGTEIDKLKDAIINGKLEEVDFWIHIGVDVNESTKGTAPLLHAVSAGNTEIVARLLRTPDININIQDRQEMTPIIRCIYFLSNNFVQITQLLVNDQRINLNIESKHGTVLRVIERKLRDIELKLDQRRGLETVKQLIVQRLEQMQVARL